MDQKSMGLRVWLAKETRAVHTLCHLYRLCKRVGQAFVSPFYRREDPGIKRFALATELGLEPRSPGSMVPSPQRGFSSFLHYSPTSAYSPFYFLLKQSFFKSLFFLSPYSVLGRQSPSSLLVGPNGVHQRALTDSESCFFHDRFDFRPLERSHGGRGEETPQAST